MSANLAAFFYLVAGVLFILALRGLSHPTTSRRGNQFGMIGMVIAVATTLAAHPPASGSAWALVVLAVAIGGGTGAVIARRVPMTSMPELVAAFHSLVGMAAVLVAAGALYAPAAFDIGTKGAIHGQSLIEMSLGVAIGAVTFTGSVIAFLKLSGRMSGAPIILPARHVIHAVGPIWRGGAAGEDRLLASCYRRAVELGRDRALTSIAFPAISTGIYRFPADRAAGIAVSATIAALPTSPTLERVVFCCFSDGSARLHARALADV